MGDALLLFNISRPQRLIELSNVTQMASRTLAGNTHSAARMCAQLAIMDVSDLGALRERRAKAIVLEGPANLYRMWDSSSDNLTRHWWFSENLFNLASSQSAAVNQSTRDWLRDRLAVSFNFGNCNRISKLKSALEPLFLLSRPGACRCPILANYSQCRWHKLRRSRPGFLGQIRRHFSG